MHCRPNLDIGKRRGHVERERRRWLCRQKFEIDECVPGRFQFRMVPLVRSRIVMSGRGGGRGGRDVDQTGGRGGCGSSGDGVMVIVAVSFWREMVMKGVDG